jgi:hypothetical protein
MSLIWKHRNGVDNIAENKAKQLEALKEEISQAYQDYDTDHFIISRNLSSLFQQSLDECMEQDIDTFRCWIQTFKEAKQTQMA